MDYIPTNLEMEVEKELKRLNVISPIQLLDIEGIAYKYNILLKSHRGPSVSGIFSGVKIIKVDSRLHYLAQDSNFSMNLAMSYITMAINKNYRNPLRICRSIKLEISLYIMQYPHLCYII
nr:hypothetical protein [Gracilibacillus suaedae]